MYLAFTRKSFPFSVLLFLAGFAVHVSAQAQTPAGLKVRRDSVYSSIFTLMDIGKYTEAHDQTVKHLYLYRDDKPFSAALYLALSDIERLTGNTEIAFSHVYQAEALMHAEGEEYWNLKKNTAYQRLANLYFETQRYDSAFYYAQVAIQAAEEYNPAHLSNMKLMNLPIIAHQYFLEGRYTLAEEVYKQAVTISRETDKQCAISTIYEKIAEVKACQNQYPQAIAYAEMAYRIADTCESVNYKLAAVNRSIWLYERTGDYKKVAEYLQLKMRLLEEIQLHEQKTQMHELETRFKNELQKEENKNLKTVNRQQTVQNRWQWGVIGLSALTLAVVSAFAFSYWKQKGRISKQKEEVERLNRLNQKIFSVISHDFKGPMLGIDLLLGMHEKYGMSQEAFSDQVVLLRNDVSQANLVMDNLLNWSRMELGFADFQKNTSEVATVFTDVAAQLRPVIAPKHLTVKNTVPRENQVPVPPDILKIVLRNLLANAVKYSHPSGEIEFGYEASRQRYYLKDQGIGMDPQTLDQLFLNRVDSRLGTQHESGYGIGLHLVYELLRKHKGQIWAESVPNEGTSVYLSFG